MPLVALTDSNERVVSFDLNEEDRDRGFRCPYCDSDLSLVIPKHKITHFRHHDASKCILSGESELHLECKEFLYNHYISTGKYDVELESRQFITDGIPKRIGDVVLFPKKESGIKLGPIVIEVQNSNIECSEIHNRFNDWNGGGFNMLWVLTSNNLHKKREDVLNRIYGGISHIYSTDLKKIFIRVRGHNNPQTRIDQSHFIKGYITNMKIIQMNSKYGIVRLRKIPMPSLLPKYLQGDNNV